MSCPAQSCCPASIFPIAYMVAPSLDFLVDPGADPILGPPYPAVNYELMAQYSSQPSPRVTLNWTVPGVTIDVEVFKDVFEGFIYAYRIFLTSYKETPSVASQTGTIVTVSGGGFVFIDTPTNAGQVIAWETGETATVVSVFSSTTAEVSVSQEVGPGDFSVLPAGTTFKLWFQRPNTDEFFDSATCPAQTPVFSSYEPRFDWTFVHVAPAEEVAAYVEVIAGSTSLKSNLISVLINDAMLPFFP